MQPVRRVEQVTDQGVRTVFDRGQRVGGNQFPKLALKVSAAPRWPDPLAPEAFHGLVGDIVRAIEPRSEADPAAILVQTLGMFGNVIGSGPGFRVESDFHRTNIFAVLVGETGKGRKGTPMGRVAEMFRTTDTDWSASRVQRGLSSGEGLVWAVRDPIHSFQCDKRTGEGNWMMTDAGVEDKRLMVVESEFSRVPKMASRDGNALSDTIRHAWDGGDLGGMTKNSPAKATGAHISIIGHITRDELLRCLSQTEQANGFANRFLWVCVRRSKYLPDDEDRRMDPAVVSDLQDRIRESVEVARSVGEMHRDDHARLAWRGDLPKAERWPAGATGDHAGAGRSSSLTA